VLGCTDDWRGFVGAGRFASDGGREVDDVVVKGQPGVRLRIACTLVENEALRVVEPLELIQEEAALGVEGGLTVLKGAVDAPVRGREGTRKAAPGAADVVCRERLPVRQNERCEAWVRARGRRRIFSPVRCVRSKPLQHLPVRVVVANSRSIAGIGVAWAMSFIATRRSSKDPTTFPGEPGSRVSPLTQ
jgi:hypothetical protein